MSLETISKSLSGTNAKLPPVELWDPPYCGEIDLEIKADGRWFYNGTIFKRLSLVKLFASVLKKEGDDYFLVTPVEKVKIRVEDAPFILTQWHWQDDSQSTMIVSTNVEDDFMLGESHPLTLDSEGNIYVTVRRNLTTKVHRNVYYQWVDLAKEEKTNSVTELVFYSGDYRCCLGSIDE